MKLLIEKSLPGHRATILPQGDVPAATLPEICARQAPLPLPTLAESELTRHYTALSKRVFGVDDGFYPLGSCTMKYNPRVNERVAALSGFRNVHPLQPVDSISGCLDVLHETKSLLSCLTGMDGMTLQPAAGAHGEFMGLLLIKAYHAARGDTARTTIIVPDTAHGTNPATAGMAGFITRNIVSNARGRVDLAALRAAVGPDTAGLMLTNPNTLGLFDPNILEITEIIHNAGGLCYYDGANLNALMGVARPGDMGFDVIHLNLHKTFGTPHGGGGPGSGAVGCKAFLENFLPNPAIREREGTLGFDSSSPESIGKVRSFYGNFLVCVKAYCYILSLGAEGLRQASENAALNANYLMRKLADADADNLPYDRACMHEFVLSLKSLKKQTGVSALDIAKGLIDCGMHPPTMYFPLIVEEALMFEPTETETRGTLDEAAAAFRGLVAQAYANPAALHDAPKTTAVSRPDETAAARNPIIRYA